MKRIQALLIALPFVFLLAACSDEPKYEALAPGALVLAFGDSVTHGTGAKEGEDYPTRLAQRSGWDVVNAGIPGDTARSAKSRIDQLLQEVEPELVIVELGGNDFLRRYPVAEVKEDLRAILRAVKQSGASAVLESGSISTSALKIPPAVAALSRTAAEDLRHVREVLSPAVSDLANALGVSRHAVYNWMNGERPNPEHAAKLHDLAQAADVMVECGIPITSAVLKRKIVNGRNLFEAVGSGGSSRDAAQQLVHVLRRETEQRARIAARVAGPRAGSRSAESDFLDANDVA